MNRIKIFLVDDQQMILDGLSSLLIDFQEVEILGTAKNGQEFIDLLSTMDVFPDVVLLDIEMPVMNGFATLEYLTSSYPEIKVLALSSYNEKPLIEKMIKTGASGYIVKDDDKEILKSAIHNIAKGEKYFSSSVTISLVTDHIPSAKDSSIALKEDLTNREIEVLKLIAEGFSNTEIGGKLFISHRTVDTHRTNLMKKIEVNNIAGLIRYAIKAKLVD